jgi:hypothetical protein
VECLICRRFDYEEFDGWMNGWINEWMDGVFLVKPELGCKQTLFEKAA